MPLLDQDKYNLVIEEGKAAVAAIKVQDIDTFLQKAEAGWDKFPEPKDSWNQGYNYAKMVFKHLLDLNRLTDAKLWLNRMIDNNNKLQNFPAEVRFYIGVYHFEIGDYATALDKWRWVVNDAGLRFFEDQKPEYLAFYNKPESLLK
jgi:hypothetical protein